MSMNLAFLRTTRGKQIAGALLLIFLATVSIDQVSKRQAHNELMTAEDASNLDMYRSRFVEVGTLGTRSSMGGEESSFLSLRFNYQRNRGAAFSMLSNLPDNVRVPFFYAVTLFCVIYIGFYLRSLPINFHLTRFALVMILAGAIGNFIDRVIQGYVIDFIDVSWNILGWRHDFAVFNVADIAINVGIIAFILEVLLRRKPLLADFSKTSKTLKA